MLFLLFPVEFHSSCFFKRSRVSLKSFHQFKEKQLFHTVISIKDEMTLWDEYFLQSDY